MTKVIYQEKMTKLQHKQTLLKKEHRQLLDLQQETPEEPTYQGMIDTKIQELRGGIMVNRGGREGLRALNKKLWGTREREGL